MITNGSSLTVKNQPFRQPHPAIEAAVLGESSSWSPAATALWFIRMDGVGPQRLVQLLQLVAGFFGLFGFRL